MERAVMDDRPEDQRAEVPEDVEAARERVEATRAEMNETIEAIENKLAVEQIRGRVQSAIREATVSKTQQTMQRMRTWARETTALVVAFIKQHPREAGMLFSSIVGSLVLLAARAKSKPSGEASTRQRSSAWMRFGPTKVPAGKSGPTRTLHQAAEQGRQRARMLTTQFSARVGRTAAMPSASRQIGDSFQDIARENSLTMAALAVSTGITWAAHLLDMKRARKVE
jgi:transposase